MGTSTLHANTGNIARRLRITYKLWQFFFFFFSALEPKMLEGMDRNRAEDEKNSKRRRYHIHTDKGYQKYKPGGRGL